MSDHRERRPTARSSVPHRAHACGPVWPATGGPRRIFTLDAVWDQYGRRMLETARAYLCDASAAQAACMHVLVRAADHLHDPIDADTNLWPWLRRLTEAVCEEAASGRLTLDEPPPRLPQVRLQLISEALEHADPVGDGDSVDDGDSVAAALARARHLIRARFRRTLGEFPAVVALVSYARRLGRHGERLNHPAATAPSAGVSGYLATHPLLVEAAAAFTAVVSLAGPATSTPAVAAPTAPLSAARVSLETVRAVPPDGWSVPVGRAVAVEPVPPASTPRPAPDSPGPPPAEPTPLAAPAAPNPTVRADPAPAVKQPISSEEGGGAGSHRTYSTPSEVDVDGDGSPEADEALPYVFVSCDPTEADGVITATACTGLEASGL